MNREELKQLQQEVFDDCSSILANKNQDYSDEDDPFANFKVAEKIGFCDAETGLIVRTLDKFNRIKTYLEDGELSVEDEGFDDAVKDIINYCVLLLGLVQEKESKRKDDE